MNSLILGITGLSHLLFNLSLCLCIFPFYFIPLFLLALWTFFCIFSTLLSLAASSFSQYQLYIIFIPIRFYYAGFPSLPSFHFLNFQFSYIVFIFLIPHRNQLFNNYLHSRLPLFAHLIIQRQVGFWAKFGQVFKLGRNLQKQQNIH